MLSLAEVDIEQIKATIVDYENKGIDSEFFVDKKQGTVYIRTHMAGQCRAKSAANNAFRLTYLPWLRANTAMIEYDYQVATAAHDHCVPDTTFFLPPRRPHQIYPTMSPFPQIVLEVEFSNQEDAVTSKVQNIYWRPDFFGVGDTRVEEVWGLFIPARNRFLAVEAIIEQAIAPVMQGPLVQAEPAAIAPRPEGFYLIVFTRTNEAVLYNLALGSSFMPPAYSIFATAPAICVTSFLRRIISPTNDP